MDVLTGVTQEEGHTGSLPLPSAMLALDKSINFYREEDSVVPFPRRP